METFNLTGTKSCIPIHFVTLLKLNNDFKMPQICNSAEKEMWNELYGILNEVTKQCPKSCSLFEFSGKIRSLLGYLPTRRQIQIGMFSHKKSLISIFGHKHFRPKFQQKFDIFQ